MGCMITMIVIPICTLMFKNASKKPAGKQTELHFDVCLVVAMCGLLLFFEKVCGVSVSSIEQ